MSFEAKVNQPFRLFGTITVDGIAPENPVTAVVVWYWNITDKAAIAPTDTWTATIISGALGTWEYNIPVNILNQAGDWKLEVNATSGGLTFPADSDTLNVGLRGR